MADSKHFANVADVKAALAILPGLEFAHRFPGHNRETTGSSTKRERARERERERARARARARARVRARASPSRQSNFAYNQISHSTRSGPGDLENALQSVASHRAQAFPRLWLESRGAYIT